jgi:hypothetical protein
VVCVFNCQCSTETHGGTLLLFSVPFNDPAHRPVYKTTTRTTRTPIPTSTKHINITEPMFDKSSSLSPSLAIASSPPPGQQQRQASTTSRNNHHHQEEEEHQEQRRYYREEVWQGLRHPSSAYFVSTRGNAVPSLPSAGVLLAESFCPGIYTASTTTAATSAYVDHRGHDDTPGAHRDFLLAVIDSALEILGNQEGSKEHNQELQTSNILPQ